MVLFSVLMPSYEHGRYLECAMRSVLGQSLRDLELIVVDDGSTDGSLELARRLAAADPRARVVGLERNRGIGATLDHALAMARGRIAAFLMSDDQWELSKLAVQERQLAAHPGAVAWCDAELVDEQGRLRGLRASAALAAQARPVEGDLFDALLAGNYVSLSTIAYDRERAGHPRFEPRLRYLNDYLFILELAARAPFRHFPLPLHRWRLHAHSSTHGRDFDGWRADARCFEELARARFGARLDPPRLERLRCFLELFETPDRRRGATAASSAQGGRA